MIHDLTEKVLVIKDTGEKISLEVAALDMGGGAWIVVVGLMDLKESDKKQV